MKTVPVLPLLAAFVAPAAICLLPMGLVVAASLVVATEFGSIVVADYFGRPRLSSAIKVAAHARERLRLAA